MEIDWIRVIIAIVGVIVTPISGLWGFSIAIPIGLVFIILFCIRAFYCLHIENNELVDKYNDLIDIYKYYKEENQELIRKSRRD